MKKLAALLLGFAVFAAQAGTLVLTPSISTTAVNLTTVGTTDWAEWAVSGTVAPTNTKSGGGAVIGLTNPDTIGSYSNDNRTISWTDGTPNASGSGTLGIFDNSGTSPFTITFPASTTPQRAFVYLAYFQVTASTFSCSLSDSSASPQSTAIFTNGAALGDGVAQIDYTANSSAQTLTCTWIATAGNSYNLQAAALTIPSASCTNGPVLSNGKALLSNGAALVACH